MGLAQDRDTSLGMEMLLAQILSSDVKPEKGPGGQLELLKECSICSFCGMLLSFFFNFIYYYPKFKREKFGYKLVLI